MNFSRPFSTVHDLTVATEIPVLKTIHFLFCRNRSKRLHPRSHSNVFSDFLICLPFTENHAKYAP